MLTATTDLFHKPEAVMPKKLALLTSQNPLLKLALGARHQARVERQGEEIYCNMDLPPLVHSWHHLPWPLVKGMLDLV